MELKKRVRYPRCGECYCAYREHPGRHSCGGKDGLCPCQGYVPLLKRYHEQGRAGTFGRIYSQRELMKPTGARRYFVEV